MDDSSLYSVINESTLSPSTKKQYAAALKELGKCTKRDLYDIIMHPETYSDIDINKTCAVKTCTLKAIIALFKYGSLGNTHPQTLEAWRNHLKPYIETAQQKWDNNVPAKRTTDGIMTWKDIVQKYNTVSKKDPFSAGHVTLAMYTVIPPRRQMDYWKLRLVKTDSEKKMILNDTNVTGYLDLTVSPAKLTVTQYKTKSTYSTWNKILPLALDKIIRMHLNANPRKLYLFETSLNQPYGNRRSFAEANNNILKKVLENDKASVNIIRHAAATYVHKSTKMSIVEKRQYAYDMGHNYDTQGHYMLE